MEELNHAFTNDDVYYKLRKLHHSTFHLTYQNSTLIKTFIGDGVISHENSVGYIGSKITQVFVEDKAVS